MGNHISIYTTMVSVRSFAHVFVKLFHVCVCVCGGGGGGGGVVGSGVMRLNLFPLFFTLQLIIP